MSMEKEPLFTLIDSASAGGSRVRIGDYVQGHNVMKSGKTGRSHFHEFSGEIESISRYTDTGEVRVHFKSPSTGGGFYARGENVKEVFIGYLGKR